MEQPPSAVIVLRAPPPAVRQAGAPVGPDTGGDAGATGTGAGQYYENLLAEIREIRASERKFYQKITDIYATTMDYSTEAETTQTFFPPSKTSSISPFTDGPLPS